MSIEDDERSKLEAEIPRHGFLAAMPKRSLSRILLLLAALAGIVYLRQRTGAIAGCMADTFRVGLPPERPSPTVKARIEIAPANGTESKR